MTTSNTKTRLVWTLAALILLVGTGWSANAGDTTTQDQTDVIIPDTTLDILNRNAAITQTPGFNALRDTLAAHPGFLGFTPSFDAEPVLRGYFTGNAPTTLGLIAPAGWTLELIGDATLQRMRTPVSSITNLDDDLLTTSPTAARTGPPVPLWSTGIGPGSPILQTIPGDGTYICTAAFVFEDTNTGRYYLGSAGHCFLDEGASGTHGPGANYDASGVRVQVCVANCFFGGQLQGFLGNMRYLGGVTYARQTGSGGDVGNDFGVVEIPQSLWDLIRPEMPVWNGPTGQNGNEGTGNIVVHHGNGIDAGTVFPTKSRAGTSLNDGDSKAWQANIVINGGDSGSAISHATVSANTEVFEGTDALGVVTHGIGIALVGVPGIGYGTSIHQAISMATQANLQLRLVQEGEVIGGGPVNNAPTASFTRSCTGLSCNFDASASSDSDGTIASYSWNFGDGNTGSGATPSHTYATGGTYTVVLTVTDNGGAGDTASETFTISASGIILDTTGYKQQGKHAIDLAWSGATGTNVDIVRDGTVIATTANDGAYTDLTGNKGSRTYVYEVCNAGTSTCSNASTVVF